MGGKDDKPVIGYHYRVAYHVGLGRGPIDAFLAFAAADKIAWDGSAQTWHVGGTPLVKRGSGQVVNEQTLDATGALTSSGSIYIAKPNLFGGEKDQGGIQGPVDIMFGEADQMPNAYLRETFGDQTVAWRGFTTLAFCGGRFGAMNPMPQRPSYKVRKILKGWDGDWGDEPCWYPERAPIPIRPGDSQLAPYKYNVGMRVTLAGPFNKPNECTREMAETAGYEYTESDDYYWFWRANESGLGYIKTGGMSDQQAVDALMARGWLLNQSALLKFLEGSMYMVVLTPTAVPPPLPAGAEPWQYQQTSPFSTPYGPAHMWRVQMPIGNAEAAGAFAMNPAHSLLYVRTDGEKGREPISAINDESLRAAANQLFDEGFGLCWQYDPKQDTPDSFTQHICRIIGGSFTRSLIDGQWYLDLARGNYDIDTLPIIGDDDILEFRELPTTLDRAVNSVSVRYFDPERNEKIITPAVRALGLIRMFGEIHQTLDFPEVPEGTLAIRICERELRAYITPTRTFELVTTPRTRGIRNNQYFRLQSPRRGIADMVCIMGEQDSGTLRSGAMRRKVTQDIYGLPEASYVDIEHGVDTRPPQSALPITTARVFEAPYVAVAGRLPRAELGALPDDVGYLLAVAADPGQHLDYRVAVAPVGDEYFAGGSGRWCATALVVEGADYTQTVFTLASGRHLAGAALGAPVLWGDEICRLDALDVAAGTIELGRGCADTVAHLHPAGERIWILTEAAHGPAEYTDGEQVDVKLLSRTATQELPLSEALVMSLEFVGRQARPYPPAAVAVNSEAYPLYLHGELIVEWGHRDRVLQADQLVDQTLASIGPEPGTTYTVRWFLDDVLDFSESGISGTSATHTPSAAGMVRVELESERNGLTSWQVQVRTFAWTPDEEGPLTIMGEIVTVFGHPIFLQE